LLDEPFGALDSKVREELRTWLRKLHDEVHVTSLFVTHDQQEAFEVSDQLVVLNHGKVEQMGPPQMLYEHPTTPFVTSFLGSVNVLKLETVLTLERGDHLGSELVLPGRSEKSLVYVRPHDLDITRAINGRPAWPSQIRKLTPLGAYVRLELVLDDGTNLLVQLSRERSLELQLVQGESVYVTPKDMKVFHESASFVEDYVI
jgi:sulfate transport system ATP-binding protein